MTKTYPNFFTDRTENRDFETVLTFIRTYFEVTGAYGYRVGQRINSPEENQRALIVFAYAQFMNYTFNQVKALFAEHDHFAIAMPETRQGRNILEFNRFYVDLLHAGHPANSRINDFPEYFAIPEGILVLK